jgi:hypothetical protein
MLHPATYSRTGVSAPKAPTPRGWTQKTRSRFVCSGGETGTQFRDGQALNVSRHSGLLLAFAKGASVEGVEPDLVDQLGDGPLPLFVP